jgi:hypothetical protein
MMAGNEKIESTTKTGSNGNEISVVESDDVEYNGVDTKKMPMQVDLSRKSMLEVKSYETISSQH